MAGRRAPTVEGEVLAERLRACLADDDVVVLAYLFGSWARGTEGPLSDVDVAVLLSPVADAARQPFRLVAQVAEAVGSEDVDLVILNDAPVALAYRVLRDGRLLVSRDETTRIRFWTATVDRYLDMAPARRILQAGLANRLAEGRFGRR